MLLRTKGVRVLLKLTVCVVLETVNAAMVLTTVSTPQRSDPKLSEVARHLIIPDGIVTSLFPRIERRMAEADGRRRARADGAGLRH